MKLLLSAVVLLGGSMLGCGSSVSDTFVADAAAKEKACFGAPVEAKKSEQLGAALTCANLMYRDEVKEALLARTCDQTAKAILVSRTDEDRDLLTRCTTRSQEIRQGRFELGDFIDPSYCLYYGAGVTSEVAGRVEACLVGNPVGTGGMADCMDRASGCARTFSLGYLDLEAD